MQSRVFVERCPDYDIGKVVNSLEKLLRNTAPRLSKSPVILLKPNLLLPSTPEKAVTTHPALVEALARLLPKHYPGCRLILGDSSGCGGLKYTKEAIRVCGMQELCERFNIIPVPFDGQELIRVPVKKGVVMKEIHIPKPLLEADMVINIPKLKTHTLTIYSGAVKNLYGCLPGSIKARGHSLAVGPSKFSDLTLDVLLAVKPKLNIMDAVEGMQGAGPVHGSPKHTGYLLAGTDAVAIDMAACMLAGIPERRVPLFQSARKRGLYNDIKIIGEFTAVNYALPPRGPGILNFLPRSIGEITLRVFSPLYQSFPEFNYTKCTKCYACIKTCPVRALQKSKQAFPILDRSKCISCLACSENCQYGAITAKPAAVLKPLQLIRRWGLWKD